ncbi:MAG: group II intron reverse transcriptase/maturase [Polyangiaceae bacterium]
MSSSEAVSTKYERIAELAKQMPTAVMWSLSKHMDVEWLREAYRRTRKDGASGVDGQSAKEYEKGLEGNLEQLLNRAKSGTYRAPPVRRVHIPKGDGQTRPLGIPTFEDKVLQRAVAMLLEAVYEQDFLDCSYGFRPRRGAHQALGKLRDTLMEMGGGWALEVDIRKYFDTIDHEQLRRVLGQRIGDGVVLRLIDKWLNAGVMEKGELSYPETGTPQGGVISPMLANIFLHAVLDTWFESEVKSRLRGRAELVRFADDFVIAFEREDDARRVHEVLPKRFAKYGLTLHPEKTRLVPFRRPPYSKDDDGTTKGSGQGTFDLLGFTLYWARSKQRYWVIQLQTARDRFTRALRRLNEWCRRNRHQPVSEQAKRIRRAVVGHFNYFGIVGNQGRLLALRRVAYRIWRSWLNRRSQRSRVTWAKMKAIYARYPLPRLPEPRSLRALAKP